MQNVCPFVMSQKSPRATSFRWHAALQIPLSGGHFAASRLQSAEFQDENERAEKNTMSFSWLTIRKPSFPNFRQPTDVNHLQQQKTKAQHWHRAPLCYSSTGFTTVWPCDLKKRQLEATVGHFATRGEDRTTEKGKLHQGKQGLAEGLYKCHGLPHHPCFCFCCGSFAEAHTKHTAAVQLVPPTHPPAEWRSVKLHFHFHTLSHSLRQYHFPPSSPSVTACLGL